jgi:type III restriction enzyme
MIESKMSSQINAFDVQAKRKAAERYCSYASAYTAQHQGKPWKYVIIPHNVINRTMGLSFLISLYKIIAFKE